jgi:hypothetical protein
MQVGTLSPRRRDKPQRLDESHTAISELDGNTGTSLIHSIVGCFLELHSYPVISQRAPVAPPPPDWDLESIQLMGNQLNLTVLAALLRPSHPVPFSHHVPIHAR